MGDEVDVLIVCAKGGAEEDAARAAADQAAQLGARVQRGAGAGSARVILFAPGPGTETVLRVGAEDLAPARGAARARVWPDAVASAAGPGGAPFQVPYGALVLPGRSGRLALTAELPIPAGADLAIAVGRAAGAGAALAASRGIDPADLDPRLVQSHLIDAGQVLFPFLDVAPGAALFATLQRLFARGLFDECTPLEFEPERGATPAEAADLARRFAAATGRPPPARAALAWAGFSRAGLAVELERLASEPA